MKFDVVKPGHAARVLLLVPVALLVVAGCSQGQAQPTIQTAAPATASSAATSAPETPVASASTQPTTPAAPGEPTGFTAADVTQTDSSPCTTANPNSDICLSLHWTAPAGKVDGYHIYASRDGGAYAGAPLPSGWYDCPQGGAGAQPVQSVAAGTTSFYLPLDGEYRPQCVAVAAYNAVGQSPWAAVMVTEEGGMIDPTKTFVGDGYSVQYPCAYQGFNSLPVNVTDGYTYFDSPSFCDVGVNSSNEFMLAVQHITFSGQKPAATGPTLAAFLVKSLTLFAPYSLSAGTPADVKAVTLNGHSGYSFTINDGGYETGEVFLIGNDLFGVVGGGLAGDANKATIAKFVQSFQLT